MGVEGDGGPPPHSSKFLKGMLFKKVYLINNYFHGIHLNVPIIQRFNNEVTELREIKM